MSIWRILYRCRRCATVDKRTASEEEICKSAVLEASITGSCARYGVPVNLISTHLCADGAMGVTDLIGTEREPAAQGEEL